MICDGIPKYHPIGSLLHLNYNKSILQFLRLETLESEIQATRQARDVNVRVISM